ncbi:MAG: MBL fold metallo-hydrolase [Candidatus Hadarchaeales archaeon]
MAALRIFDGVDTIGGNKIYLESGGRGLLLDFGLNFGRMGEFYEEFLRLRSVRGVHDYLHLGLVPPLDIYEQTLFPSDFNPQLEQVKVDAVLLTHAHLDHCGCVGLLRRDLPVYCSAMTAAILKAYQDSGKVELHSEVAYSRQRLGTEDPRVLEASQQADYLGRPFCLFESPSRELLGFWEGVPGEKEIQSPRLQGPCTPPLPLLRFEVEHSIFGASAYAIETEKGWVVYTGDLRAGEGTERFVREAAKLDVRVLVVEGTCVGRREESVSEEEVYENCLSVVEGERGLVVADFSARHFERLQSFARVAEKTGRRLVVLPRDIYMLEALEKVDGRSRTRGLLVYRELRAMREGWVKQVFERHRERYIDPDEIAKNPGGFILCFSFYDVKNLLDIKPKGGTYIYSGSEAFNEEATFDFVRLWNWLKKFNLRAVGFEVRKGELKFEHGYHASGHASSRELLELIEEIDPKMVVPVHTEDPKFFRKKVKKRKVVLPVPGEKIAIE